MNLQTLSQACGAIAREVSLDKLLVKAINILRDYTEARLGFLLLESENEWWIEAQSIMGNDPLNQFLSIPRNYPLPRSIIRQVANLQSTVIVNDLDRSGDFSHASYFPNQEHQSIVCAPLKDGSQLKGIVYLENNQVFTARHLQNLQFLSEQVGIALANAQMYQKLRDNQQRIHQFLEDLPVGVEVLDAREKLYYTNQRAKELRAKGIVAEVAPYSPIKAKVDSDDPMELTDSLSGIGVVQDTTIVVNEQENSQTNKINLVESWSNSIADEQGETIYTINAFQDITEHKKAEQLLAEYNRTLEIQVAERTLELSQALENLKTAQNKLIQSEKMVALGQLVAGVAHEINTPLGVIRASSYNNVKALGEFLEQMPQLFQKLSLSEQELFFQFLERSLRSKSNPSSREKRKLKRDLISQLQEQSITKARYIAGILTDIGIYQEIDSFLALFQSPNVDLILQLAYNLSRLHSNSNNIIIAVERASKVVFALKNYARYDPTGEKQIVDLTEGIETVLELYHNQLKQGIEVIREYQPLPLILCYPDELMQVWTNLIHNAIQAMKGKGELGIQVESDNNEVIVRITDSGCGIAENIKDKIFQPFFTTKPMGEGSGLGLDIARKIIEKHQGYIEVESKPGCTTFQVRLPIES